MNGSIIAFNWTKVELKLSSFDMLTTVQSPFHWTKVELKLSIQKKVSKLQEAFNWTKVELKPKSVVKEAVAETYF